MAKRPRAALARGEEQALAALRALGLGPAELRLALGVPGRGALKAESLKGNVRLLLLAEIFDLAFQVHGAGAQRWFQTAEPKLGNVLPATLLRDPQNGPNLVKQTLLNTVCGTL